MKAIPTVLSQYAEEAAMLWLMRRVAVGAPHYSLADVSKLDGRVEAHLDGLRVAGEEGWQLCRKELAWKEPGEVFAAALLAFESGNEQRIAEVLKVGSTEVELARGLISALGWRSFPEIEDQAKRLASAASPSLHRLSIAVFAVHRQNPGEASLKALKSEDPSLKARASKAVGELGRLDLLQETLSGLPSDHPEVRFWAAWSASLLSNHAGPLATLQAIAESTSPRRERALQLAMRRMEPNKGKAWQKKLAQNAAHIRLAIIGAGALGDPELVPWLIQQMEVPELTRVAGEAFTTITGIDLGYQDLDANPPEDFEAGPTENPEDENVEMDPDENLPWPDPALTAQWWGQHQSEFQRGTRHLIGKPTTIDWLQQVLRVGRQRQRAAAALELAIRQPGTPLFNVAAPGFRQQQLLGLRR